VVTKNASASDVRHAIDWSALESSVADSRTLEQAIGRAVVIADRMCRGVFDGAGLADSAFSLNTENPFFAFSMADVVPDFGGEHRYRSRMSRIFRASRQASA
jgi:hypothetical protein